MARHDEYQNEDFVAGSYPIDTRVALAGAAIADKQLVMRGTGAASLKVIPWDGTDPTKVIGVASEAVASGKNCNYYTSGCFFQHKLNFPAAYDTPEKRYAVFDRTSISLV